MQTSCNYRWEIFTFDTSTAIRVAQTSHFMRLHCSARFRDCASENFEKHLVLGDNPCKNADPFFVAFRRNGLRHV